MLVGLVRNLFNLIRVVGHDEYAQRAQSSKWSLETYAVTTRYEYGNYLASSRYGSMPISQRRLHLGSALKSMSALDVIQQSVPKSASPSLEKKFVTQQLNRIRPQSSL